MNPKKKPKFLRQEWYRNPSLGKKWRAPKGKQSKLRRHKKGKGFIPTPGYGSPKTLRGKHPCGLQEVLVRNLSDMDNVKQEEQCIRIASKVGRKTRQEIIKRAEEIGLNGTQFLDMIADEKAATSEEEVLEYITQKKHPVATLEPMF